ncbi:TfoX/Sxy family protein [Dokdonella koreensis]|uniref:TfoX C-terminal domain-containing protein n=1 Tax=Dokdonella koreensis DS-123 TaxID=1300342 RepID=A0A160DWT7_9GAMM|nr:TfoX/Sxy family protein [Dokdonella koreensis]ANB19117.1 TfoX C-terminal domain-containing protein [Dokdonella koreensis DS-123]
MANEKIRNVGPKSAAWLRQVGVRTLEDLQRIGPVEAFLKTKRAGFRPSLNLLYSMAGALADCHWTELGDTAKHELIAALEAAEAANPIRNRWEKGAQRSAQRDGDGSAPAAAAEEGDGFGDGDSGVRELTGTHGDFD